MEKEALLSYLQTTRCWFNGWKRIRLCGLLVIWQDTTASFFCKHKSTVAMVLSGDCRRHKGTFRDVLPRPQRGQQVDAVPQILQPDVLVEAVLIVIVIRDRHSDGGGGANLFAHVKPPH